MLLGGAVKVKISIGPESHGEGVNMIQTNAGNRRLFRQS